MKNAEVSTGSNKNKNHHGWEQISQSKISKRTKAKLGASAIDLKNFKENNEQYQEEKATHEEYILNKKQIDELNEVRKYYPEYYHDWQIECMEAICNEENVILSSPTGSGKTAVFLDWANEKKAESLEEGIENHTIYITAPIKALSNQRFRELRDAGYKVGLETGDIKNVPDDAEYICCTQEIYTNKYTKNENATLIVDELHYIFEDRNRQRAYIDGINQSEAKNMLLCSATFGDIGTLNKYLQRTTKRDFDAYENSERLTSLNYRGRITPDRIQDALVVAFSVRNCEAIADELVVWEREENDEFREKLQERESLIKEICKKHSVEYDPRLGLGVATYYGKKLPKEKACIEELFEKRLIDTVVGTDALALGVNFPVEKVVFAELEKRYDGRISKNLFDQLAGRAGRKGYFDTGSVYYCDSFIDRKGYTIGCNVGVDYFELMGGENESVQIDLQPKIKNILLGKTTIDEETKYIVENSTSNNVEYEDKKLEIQRALNIINDFNLSELLPLDEKNEPIKEAYEKYQNAIKNTESWDYEDATVAINEGNHLPLYKDGIEYRYIDVNDKEDETNSGRYSFGLTQDGEIIINPEVSSFNRHLPTEKTERLINLVRYARANKEEYIKRLEDEYLNLKNEYDARLGLDNLKQQFLYEIKDIYNEGLSVEENCNLCAGLIMGRGDDIFDIRTSDYWNNEMPEEPLIYLEGNYFRALCQKRQIIMNLPRKYRARFDIAELKKDINMIDSTTLNEGIKPAGLFSAKDIKNLLEEESA